MKAYYINLSEQSLRREVLQRNFSQFSPPDRSLHKVVAVSEHDVRERNLPGRIKDVEKACYLSHVKALRMACENDTHAYILEDDAHFGPHSFDLLGLALTQLEVEGKPWDILYTQVMPVCPEHMVELLRIRSECVREKKVCVVNSHKMVLAGACSYVVNAPAKQRLLNLLDAQTTLDTPIDSYYWRLAREGVLQARVVFPLCSSVNPEATVSQIQPATKAQATLIWNAWMRLSAYDRDVDEIEADLAHLPTISETLPQVQTWLTQMQAYSSPQELRIMQIILSNMCAANFQSLFSVTPDAKKDM